MAKYRGEAGRTNGRNTCEVCGHAPQAEWHREVQDGQTVNIAPHGRNRVLVNDYMARRAGRPELAGKRLCPQCYGRLISAPANR